MTRQQEQGPSLDTLTDDVRTLASDLVEAKVQEAACKSEWDEARRVRERLQGRLYEARAALDAALDTVAPRPVTEAAEA